MRLKLMRNHLDSQQRRTTAKNDKQEMRKILLSKIPGEHLPGPSRNSSSEAEEAEKMMRIRHNKNGNLVMDRRINDGNCVNCSQVFRSSRVYFCSKSGQLLGAERENRLINKIESCSPEVAEKRCG